MTELARLTSSDLLADSRNPAGGTDMLVQAVKEIPSAASELAAEAWAHPVDAAIHAGKTIGMGIAFGGAFGYLIPGRGPVAALLGTALTVPAVTATYNRLNGAMLDAQRSNADIKGIAHSLARDTVTSGADFALGMAGGLAGSQLGRQLAMSETLAGRLGQQSQRLVLSAENNTMSGLRRLFTPEEKLPTEFQVSLRDPNAKIEELQFRDMPWSKRTSTLVSNRIDQFDAVSPEYKMYYGSTHGHSVYSDGMGMPAEIYQRAKDLGLDFTAITDHSHTSARSGVPPGDPRYPGQQKTTSVAEDPIHYTETINAAKTATQDGKFVAIYGVELGTIGKVGSTGPSGVNHINVLQTDTFYTTVKQGPKNAIAPPPVEKIYDGNYKMLVDALDKTTDATGGRPVIQLNHPRWSADESPNLPEKVRGRDYGQKSFSSNKEWVDRFGKYASQMEIINGDALGQGGIMDVSPSHLHGTDFAGYLDKGLKISPTFGRDFHYGDPGGTKAATGILSQNLDAKSLLDALRARRTIATTNRDLLTGHMTVNDAHPMGSVLDQKAVPDLNIKVTVGGKVSPDAEYTALLWGDKNLGDGKLAEVLQTKKITGAELAAAKNQISFDKVQPTLGRRSAFYVELQRLPAEGDPASLLQSTAGGAKRIPDFLNSSRPPVFSHSEVGSAQADPSGKFLGDRLWTAPVWSEPLAGENHSFVMRALVGIGSTVISGH